MWSLCYTQQGIELFLKARLAVFSSHLSSFWVWLHLEILSSWVPNRHSAVLWKHPVLKGTHSYHNTNSTTSYRHKNRGFITATVVRFPLSASHAIPRGVSLISPKTTTFWFMSGVEWDRVEKSQTSEPSSNDSSITRCDYACSDVSKKHAASILMESWILGSYWRFGEDNGTNIRSLTAYTYRRTRGM